MDSVCWEKISHKIGVPRFLPEVMLQGSIDRERIGAGGGGSAHGGGGGSTFPSTASHSSSLSQPLVYRICAGQHSIMRNAVMHRTTSTAASAHGSIRTEKTLSGRGLGEIIAKG